MTRIYVAMEQDLLVAWPENGRWRLDARLEGRPMTCLAADPLRPEVVYCGTFGQGLWRSRDAGATWQPRNSGLTIATLTAVAVSERDRVGPNGVVWVGTEPSDLFRSVDGGVTWCEQTALRQLPSAPTWSFPPRPHTSHVRWITPDPVQSGRLYVCIERGGVMRSLDEGWTFADRRPGAPLDVHTLRMHPAAPNRLYAAAGDGFLRPGTGYAESRDGGDTWQYPDDGIQRHYLWGIAVDPGDPDTVIVSAAHSPAEAHDPRVADSVIYRRVLGQHWREAFEGLPEPKGTIIPALASNDAEPGIFYAAMNWGIFRSADAGETWEQLPIPWPSRYHQQHVQALVVTP